MNSIFYHCFCIGDYQQRFIKTYNKIVSFGLLQKIDKIYLCCVGTPSFIQQLPKVVLHRETQALPSYEKITLDAIVEFSKQTNNKNILYLHSKGVTKNSLNVQHWIDLMEYFLIEKHSNCTEKLDKYDAVGVNYSEEIKPHFSGNFWWATTNYLKNKLPAVDTKNDGEFWLLNTPGVRYSELYNSKVNHYKMPFSREKYEHL